MKLFILFILVGFSVWAWFFINAFRRKQKRGMLLSTPFPTEWDAILKKNLPPYGNLPPDLLRQLQDATRIFMAEKSFEGCGGLTLTDEIKVTIAAQACMLLLNREMEYYPRLYSILVYPSTYVAGTRPTIKGQPDETSVRLGESWHTGAVVLAWDSVKHGAANFTDGHNVTMHEFAHQLDQHYSAADGAPVLASRSAYSAWAQVFSKEYELLRRETAKGRKSVMDAYGATNPAEFFAVATETFFEKPVQLKKKHPELYEELYGFYKVNPVEWE
ncbi:MAG: zinc-dependent peptidase [Deltaproteobacteria bacterium]|jgi:Mlc titration factor MtfA (ptsG expression regulator)|nr:zinc-dependent peptidase [Deltaproteobacteria bacterium]